MRNMYTETSLLILSVHRHTGPEYCHNVLLVTLCISSNATQQNNLPLQHLQGTKRVESIAQPNGSHSTARSEVTTRKQDQPDNPSLSLQPL